MQMQVYALRLLRIVQVLAARNQLFNLKNYNIMANNLDSVRASQNHIKTSNLPKSGFNLGYQSNTSNLAIGRLYPTMFQHIMPNDKFNGSNKAKLTFNDLVTPVAAPLTLSQHNFFVPLRGIDSTFEKRLSRNSKNIGENPQLPSFDINDMFRNIFNAFLIHANFTYAPASGSNPATFTDNDQMFSNVVKFMQYLGNPTSTLFHLGVTFCGDSLQDLYAQMRSHGMFDANGQYLNKFDYDGFRLVLYNWFDFFCGQGSLLDYFGYPIFTHDMVDSLLSSWVAATTTSQRVLKNCNLSTVWTAFLSQYPEDAQGSYFVNEYPLRAYYAVWFDFYRKPDYEERSITLPDYRDFGATSQLANQSGYFLLVTRVRCWGRDQFTTASPDNIYMHVYAPIVATNDGSTAYSAPTMPIMRNGQDGDFDASNSISNLSIPYMDTDGVARTITCPMPIVSPLLSSDIQRVYDTIDVYGLDLNMLRKSNQMANFLKRLSLGDEYRDYILNEYGAVVEDYRINRPLLIGQSVDTVDINQHIAQSGSTPNGNDVSGAFGKRQVTMDGTLSGADGFSMFTSEFGIVIGITSMLPTAQYNVQTPQNRMLFVNDLPVPAFAPQGDELISSLEMSRHAYMLGEPFGHIGYAHAYKQRPNEVHGDYIDTKSSFSFARFFGADSTSRPKLNSAFMHCRPRVDMFADRILLNGQAYASFEHNFLVERALPTDIEVV